MVNEISAQKYMSEINSAKADELIKRSRPLNVMVFGGKISNPLEEMFERQHSFLNKFYKLKELSFEERQKLTKEYVLCMIAETTEILDEINWKLHKNSIKPVDVEHLLEECIDAFKFLLNIILIWNYDHNDFTSKFHEKSSIVEKRWESKY